MKLEKYIPENVFSAVLDHLSCSLPDKDVHRAEIQQWIILSKPKIYIYPLLDEGVWEAWNSGTFPGIVTSNVETSCEDIDLVLDWVYQTLKTFGIDCSSVKQVKQGFKPRVVYPVGEQQELCL